MRELVVKNADSWYQMKTDDGQFIGCRIKNSFWLKGIHSTDPVAVDDRVQIILNQKGTAFTDKIEDRENYIIRRSSSPSKQSRILATNLDQYVLVVIINYPETSTVSIDHFLAPAEACRVPVKLVFNKVDVYNKDELCYLDAPTNLHTRIDYPRFKASAKEGAGVDIIKEDLEGKITLFSGHSGVGKSTFANAILSGTGVKTGKISTYHNRSMHTTTFSETFSVDRGGHVTDTPGIRGSGTFDMKEKETGYYFLGIFKISADYRYGSYTHRREPRYAVRKTVERHLISESHYTSYLNMLENKEEGKCRVAR